ncbi:hypothetical protein [Aquibacillus kalidii]|uniref:hypothetical protein n=1 Tax=Aquibacillus kalidii TaxID=2762597 RepID=UPI00164457DB|nr:hypothetical protein [Aquibacillus kalidii]
MSLSFFGFLSIMCGFLVMINKNKFYWLVVPMGFKNNSKVAIGFYLLLGAGLLISGVVNIPYINHFVLPALVLGLSLFTILVINSKKTNEAS